MRGVDFTLGIRYVPLNSSLETTLRGFHYGIPDFNEKFNTFMITPRFVILTNRIKHKKHIV